MGQCFSAIELKDEIVSGRYGPNCADANQVATVGKIKSMDPTQRSRALKWSVQGNSNALVKAVLDMGVHVNHRDKRHRTALHHAVAGRKPESIIETMSRLGACDDLSSSVRILEQYKADSTIRRYESQIILTLLQAGADVDLIDGHGWSALMYAVWTGNLFGVTEILSHKPRLDMQDKDGETALISAASLGHTEIAKALVGAGANLDVRNKDNDTALICAASWGHTDIAKALVTAGANLDVREKDGYTALILAASGGHTEIAKALVGAGANLDVQNEYGNTALILAASNGHTEVTRMLVACGAQLNIRDNDGDTALICAVDCSQPHTADVIVSSARPGTLDIDAVDKEGWTAVTLARNKGYHPLAEKLILYGARREMDQPPEEMGHAQESSSSLDNWKRGVGAFKVGFDLGDILSRL